MLGGNNDLNVLDRNPLIFNFLCSPYVNLEFEVNGHVYSKYYLLVDGIYLKHVCFVQTIHKSQGEKCKHFTRVQESIEKDWMLLWCVAKSIYNCIKTQTNYGTKKLSMMFWLCVSSFTTWLLKMNTHYSWNLVLIKSILNGSYIYISTT